MKNWQQEINKYKKLIIYGILTLCLIIANYTLLFKPTWAIVKQTTPEVRILRNRLATAKNSIANMPRFKVQIKEMQKRVAIHQNKFSSKQDMSSILKGLSDTAKDTSVKIIAIKPYPAVENPSSPTSAGYKKAPISVKASCGYHQLGKFLNRLENADTLIRVSDIKIVNDSKDDLQHQVYLLVNTFILTEDI